MNEQLLQKSDADVLSARRKLGKPYGVGIHPLVCPRVKDLICNLITIKFYGCKNELHKRVVSVLIWGRGYQKLQSVYLHIPEQWKLLLKLFEITQIFKICVHGL